MQAGLLYSGLFLWTARALRRTVTTHWVATSAPCASFTAASGRNVAENLALAGSSPVFVSSVDEGGLGGEVLARLAADGVDVSRVRPRARRTVWGSGSL